MPPDHPAEGFEHGLDAQRAVEYGEDTLSKGIAEATDTLTPARLSRADEDDRRGRIHSAEDLKHLLARRTLVAIRLHGEFQVDQRDVDLLLLDQSGGISAASGFQTSDPEGIQQPGQFRRRSTLTPGGGEQQIQSAGCR
jgi:hypothetical protein